MNTQVENIDRFFIPADRSARIRSRSYRSSNASAEDAASFHRFRDSARTIGIEDCVKVTRALDEALDQIPEIEGIFHGAYELEVSSPGVDRPLRRKKDFERFAGKLVRLHTFRALSEEEIGNREYFSRNSKQKNFVGELKGMNGDRIKLAISQGEKASAKKKKGLRNRPQKQ